MSEKREPLVKGQEMLWTIKGEIVQVISGGKGEYPKVRRPDGRRVTAFRKDLAPVPEADA